MLLLLLLILRRLIVSEAAVGRRVVLRLDRRIIPRLELEQLSEGVAGGILLAEMLLLLMLSSCCRCLRDTAVVCSGSWVLVEGRVGLVVVVVGIIRSVLVVPTPVVGGRVR